MDLNLLEVGSSSSSENIYNWKQILPPMQKVDSEVTVVIVILKRACAIKEN